MAGDPAVIRSLAVSAEDVVDAFVYTQLNPGYAVLRVTPPFHGRMRARLHVSRDDLPGAETGAIHIQPRQLLESNVVAAYPTLESVDVGGESESELASKSESESEPETASGPETIRDTHQKALETWRERALEAIVNSVTFETDDGEKHADVKRMN